ncbi:hypothetical protein [Nostoc sp. CCY0012]|uniref:hypothetical protein n=1 Tax=Nostoc sp. CCY0012 TaxID=1056123 RepID=UPI0039C6B5AF
MKLFTFNWIKIAILNSLLVGNLSIFSPQNPALSQTEVEACKAAISNAKNRIQQVPYVVIQQNWTRDNSERYLNLPPGRNIEYIFHLGGYRRNGRELITGIQTIGNSPQFMKSISQEIITKCSSVNSVSFGSTFAPGCGITWGIMNDGTIKEFTMVDDWEVRSPKLKWGESVCM